MKKFFKWVGIAFVGLIILGAIGSVFSDSETTETKESEAPKTEETVPTTAPVESKEESKQEEVSEPVEEVVTVGIGQELQVGDVVFKVNGIEETNEISDAGGYIKHTPESDGATFLIADVTISNKGKEAIQTDSSFFKILTSDGIEYTPSTIFVTDDSYFLYDSINPNLSQTGKVLFEVPSGMTDLQLQVQTGFWGTETGIINLQ